MNDLQHAIDELLAFVGDADRICEVEDATGTPGEGITVAAMERFHELDVRLLILARKVGLSDRLPNQFVLERWYHMEGLPLVKFEGQTMLPGDWCDGVFQPVMLGRWRQDMLDLRALATPEEPLRVTLDQLARVTLGRVEKKTLANGEKPLPVDQQGQANVYQYSDWIAIWPKGRNPLPDEAGARQILADSQKPK